MQVLSIPQYSTTRCPLRAPQIAAVRPGAILTRSELQRIVAEMLD